MRYVDIERGLQRLLEDFGPPGGLREAKYPFWHLQFDDIWEVPERETLIVARGDRKRTKDVPAPILRAHDAHGGFPIDIYESLRARPDLVYRIAGLLLEANFPTSMHEDILDAVGMPWIEIRWMPPAVLLRPTRRPRDPEFRDMILGIYGHCCAMCGYDGRLGSRPLGIEAAHVKWHALGGPDQADNGLALCTFHHKALDYGALGIDEGYRIIVSENVHGGSEVTTWLLRFMDQPLRRPHSGQPGVAHEFIQWHREQVFHAPARTKSMSCAQ